jgi:2-hydroxy-6-oxonona-2,4-dienedioate hydrolase
LQSERAVTHTEPKLADVWTRVDGRAMYARVSTGGEAGAPPMVLVHGLGVSGRYLLPTARRLMNDYPVYVPDLPGWGKSERPPRALTVPQAADALAAWMRQMRLAEACLVGNSLGCQFIIDLAVRYPELVGWAVLVGPTVDPAARSVFGQALRGTRDLFREPLSYWPLLTWDYLETGPIRTLVTLRHAVADPVVEKLPRVEAPTLVVRGSRDPIAPQPWVEEMVSKLPHGRLVVIPGAAHVANYTAPEDLAAAVRGFVREAQQAVRSPGWPSRPTRLTPSSPARSSPAPPGPRRRPPGRI